MVGARRLPLPQPGSCSAAPSASPSSLWLPVCPPRSGDGCRPRRANRVPAAGLCDAGKVGSPLPRGLRARPLLLLTTVHSSDIAAASECHAGPREHLLLIWGATDRSLGSATPGSQGEIGPA